MDSAKHIINHDVTVIEALRRLNTLSGEAMTLMVVDADGRLVGSLTDGDIRRALIAGAQLGDEVASVMHRGFASVAQGDIDIERIAEFRGKGIRLLPIVDSEDRIVRLIDLGVTSTLLPLSALIMAGGRGERLRPLTLSVPKPLLEVGGRPIIDYAVDALGRCGIDDIKVSVNYLADMIIDHFRASNSAVVCVREEHPLGTIGALASAGPFAHPDVLVMNSDLLTDISFEDMYLHHVAHSADITMAVLPYSFSVPYAIVNTDGQQVVSLEEKPTYSYYANAGIYIVGARARALIKAGERTDAPDLIAGAIALGLTVAYFPVDGTWIDIGTPADYTHACDIMNSRGL